jgi:PAS domain S-box-containing protein
MDFFRKLSLLSKMTLVIALVLFSFFALANYLDYRQEREKMMGAAVDKARILALEAIRTREYLSDQYLAGEVELSEKRFGLIPVVASGRIGERVARDLGYSLRQVSERNRNPDNAPDAFEISTLQKFYADGSLQEAYSSTTLDGKPVFRYLRSFAAKKSCLQCHGTPEKAPDFLRSRYPVEKDQAYHYKTGEVIGAASIIIPMDNLKAVFYRNLRRDVLQRSMVFLALVLCLCLLGRRAIILPLQRLAAAMNGIIRTGRFQNKLTTRKKDEIGRLIETFNSMVDHLQEKSEHLEESEKRFRILTETARDAIVSFLSNGQIILFNSRAEQIFGYRKKDVIGFPVDRLIHKENAEIHDQGLDAYLREKADTALSRLHRIVGKRRDGTSVILEVSLSMAESDGHIFYTAILREEEAGD